MLKHAYDKVTVALLVTLAVTYAALIWLVVPVLPPLPQAVLFLAITSMLAFTVICRTDSRRLAKRPGVAVLARRYRLLYAIAAGWFAAYMIGAVIAAVVQPDQDVPDGQPEIVAGRHYLNVHGSLVPVTKAEYEHDTRIWEMSFLSVSMILNLANLIVMANAGKAAAAAQASRT